MNDALKVVCLAYDELTSKDVFAMLQLRQDVFIVEQNCVYQDIDHKDKDSFHLFVWRGDPRQSALLAYARLVKPSISYKEPSIGRVVSSKAARGLGMGRLVVHEAIKQIQTLFPGANIRISAQCYLENFYGEFGFEPVSDEYLEDDIPHVEMLLISN